MITAADFARVRSSLGEKAEADISWASTCAPPATPEGFAREVIFVICNSGMKHTVARLIFERCMTALESGKSASTAFEHHGKAGAMDRIWANRVRLHGELLDLFAHSTSEGDAQLVEFAADLPWIGKITKFHVAKNFGAQVAKPDVHLQRLADLEDTTPQALCERLATETGLNVNAVDTVLWRACATGVINSRTGNIASADH